MSDDKLAIFAVTAENGRCLFLLGLLHTIINQTNKTSKLVTKYIPTHLFDNVGAQSVFARLFLSLYDIVINEVRSRILLTCK